MYNPKKDRSPKSTDSDDEDRAAFKKEDDKNERVRQARSSVSTQFPPGAYPLATTSNSGLRKSRKTFKESNFEIWKIHYGNETYFVEIYNDKDGTVGKLFYSFISMDSNFKKLEKSTEIDQNKSTINIQDFKNQKHQNLLIFAAENNHNDIIEKLPKYNFDIDHEDDKQLNAIDYLWMNYVNKKDKNISKTILILLKANSKFPKEKLGFEYEKAMDDVKRFIDMSEEMHRLIDKDDVRGIQELLNQNCGLRYFYDRFNESAMFFALKKNRVNSINFIKKCLTINQSEKLSDIFGEFDSSLDNEGSLHILILNSKSKILNNTRNSQQYWELINEAYESLDKIQIGSKILKIAALYKELSITFDFMDGPEYSKDINENKLDGSSKIHIQIKSTTYPDKCAALCDLVEKLSHLVIKIAFLEDYVVTERLKKPEHQEQHSELSEKLSKAIKEVFGSYSNSKNNNDLFNYFEATDVKKIQQTLKYLHDRENIVEWDDLTDPMKAKILSSKVIFQGVETTFNDMIGEDSKVLKCLSSLNIQNILLRNEKVMIGEAYSCGNYIERRFTKYAKNCVELSKKPDCKNQEFHNQESTVIKVKNSILAQNIQKSKLPAASESLNIAQTSKFDVEPPNTMNYKQVMSSVKASNLFILVGSAGSGKSTAFRDLAIKLKMNYASHWVALVKIRKTCEAIEARILKEAELTIEDIPNLFLELLNIKSRLEIKVFKNMFKNNKVILLFDGLDEIKDENLNSMIKVIKLTKDNTSNQLWISTRHHLERKLSGSFETESIYYLYPMTKTIDIPKELSDFINQLEHGNNKIENPLMIEIIAQLYAENVIKLSKDLLNLYEVFEAVYKRLQLKFYEKIENTFDCHQDRFSIDDIHQVYALKIIFGHETVEELAITKNWEIEKRHWTSKAIEQWGFLTVDLEDTENNVSFIHKSFIEFFAAKYILSFLYGTYCGVKDEEFTKAINLLNMIAKEDFKNQFGSISKFVWGYITTKKQPFHETVTKILENDANVKNDPLNYFKSLLQS